MVASHIQRICSVADLSLPKARSALAQHGHGSLVAFAEQGGEGVEQHVGSARRAQRGGSCSRGLRDVQRAAAWPGEAPREQGR